MSSSLNKKKAKYLYLYLKMASYMCSISISPVLVLCPLTHSYI
jgi:hypothetical protein